MDLIPQREHWSGPERLSPGWTLSKDRKTAECVVWSHQFGFELRVTIGADLVQSQVCRTQQDLINIQETWRAAYEGKGWETGRTTRRDGCAASGRTEERE
jgi:hypothetical protein